MTVKPETTGRLLHSEGEGGKPPSPSQSEHIVSAVSRRLGLELDSMKGLLGEFGGSDMLNMISAEMNFHLATILGLIEGGQIFPQCNFRLSQEAPHLSPCDRPLRIGVFPTTADPFH